MSNGYYTITNLLNGLVLGVAETYGTSAMANGTVVCTWTSYNDTNQEYQEWMFQQVNTSSSQSGSSSNYYIVNRGSGLVLEYLTGQGGNSIQQWTSSGTINFNQIWKISSVLSLGQSRTHRFIIYISVVFGFVVIGIVYFFYLEKQQREGKRVI